MARMSEILIGLVFLSMVLTLVTLASHDIGDNYGVDSEFVGDNFTSNISEYVGELRDTINSTSLETSDSDSIFAIFPKMFNLVFLSFRLPDLIGNIMTGIIVNIPGFPPWIGSQLLLIFSIIMLAIIVTMFVKIKF